MPDPKDLLTKKCWKFPLLPQVQLHYFQFVVHLISFQAQGKPLPILSVFIFTSKTLLLLVFQCFTYFKWSCSSALSSPGWFLLEALTKLLPCLLLWWLLLFLLLHSLRLKLVQPLFNCSHLKFVAVPSLLVVAASLAVVQLAVLAYS